VWLIATISRHTSSAGSAGSGGGDTRIDILIQKTEKMKTRVEEMQERVEAGIESLDTCLTTAAKAAADFQVVFDSAAGFPDFILFSTVLVLGIGACSIFMQIKSNSAASLAPFIFIFSIVVFTIIVALVYPAPLVLFAQTRMFISIVVATFVWW